MENAHCELIGTVAPAGQMLHSEGRHRIANRITIIYHGGVIKEWVGLCTHVIMMFTDGPFVKN